MKTKEELLKQHAQQIAELDKEIELTAMLPIQPNLFVGPMWKAPYVCYRNEKKLFPNNVYSVDEALEIINAYKPYIVECEAWKGTFLTIYPRAIQKQEDLASGTYQYDAAISLHIGGGDGYTKTELSFYVCISGQHFKIQIEIARNPKWQPAIWREEDYRGHLIRLIKTPARIKEDHFTSWGTGDNTSYDYSYHWETLDSFLTWHEANK